MGDFNVGEYVWSIKTFEEIHWYPGRFKPTPLIKPIRYKIVHVDELSDGKIYQTKHGHFNEDMINVIVFHTEQEALNKMRS